MVNAVVITAIILDALGLGWYLLSHFGIAPYGLAVAPVFLGIGVAFSLFAAGLKHPLVLLAIAGAIIFLLELIFRFNLWGLGGGV